MIGVALIGAIGAALLVVARDRLSEAGLRGAFLGEALAALGAVGGMILLARSLGRGTQRFLAALVAGILGRLVVFGAALVSVGLRQETRFDTVTTAVSLLVFFLMFQWLELWLVLREMKGGTAR